MNTNSRINGRRGSEGDRWILGSKLHDPFFAAGALQIFHPGAGPGAFLRAISSGKK